MKWKLSLVFIILYLTSCMENKNHSSEMISFDKEGHRGCRGLMPENTIPAMLKALELGVTTLEMDVVITKDSQVIVSHEPFFNHEITTLPDGSYIAEGKDSDYNIYAMEYKEVLQFDVGLKPHPRFPKQAKLKAVKPLLSDLVDSVEHYCRVNKIPAVQYNIEIKSEVDGDNIYHPAPAVFADLLISVIRTKAIGDRVIIQSFDARALQYVHKQYPNFRTSLLMEADDKRSFEKQLAELGFMPAIYSPDYSVVDEDLINECHQKKIKIIPWTVNDKGVIEELKAIGVDGVITDYPDLFLLK